MLGNITQIGRYAFHHNRVFTELSDIKAQRTYIGQKLL